jgi:hypothetical protein
MPNSHQQAIASLERLAKEHADEPSLVAYAKRAIVRMRREGKATARFERRLAESRRLVELFSFAESKGAAEEELRKLADHSNLKIIGRPRALFLHLATIDLAILTIAIRQSAPQAMFAAIFYLPLALVRFALAKASYRRTLRSAQ